MRVRVPLFKKDIEQIDEIFTKHTLSKLCENMSTSDLVMLFKKNIGKEITEETARKLLRLSIDKNYKMKYPPGHFIKQMLLMLSYHADILRQMTWTVYRSEIFFVASDNPFVYFVPPKYVNGYTNPKSLMSEHSEAFFPLTKNIGVHFSWKKHLEQIHTVDSEIVDSFNFNISRNSYNLIFSPIKMDSLQEYIEKFIPYPFRYRIS